MTKIFESWGACFIAVIGLIALGALLGHDLFQFHCISNIISAIGTLMLGFAALLAFPVWEQQQRSKFQATISSECYAKLSAITYKLSNLVPKLRAAQFIKDCSSSSNIPPESALIRQEAIANIRELLTVLHDFVVPRSAIFDGDFYTEIEGFTFELERLISTPLKNLSDANLTVIVARLEGFLEYLRKKSMFES